MNVQFKTFQLAKLCANDKLLTRTFGADVAKQIRLRLAHLEMVPTLDGMRMLPGRCHELRNDRSGYLAVRLDRMSRLVFRPADQAKRTEAGLVWSSVTEIVVTEITDYHK